MRVIASHFREGDKMRTRNFMKNLQQNNRFVALLLIVSMLLIGSFSFANQVEQERKSQSIEIVAKFKNSKKASSMC